MRNNLKYFTNAVSLTMLIEYRDWVVANKVNITSCIYYKDGVNHYIVVSYNFTT